MKGWNKLSKYVGEAKTTESIKWKLDKVSDDEKVGRNNSQKLTSWHLVVPFICKVKQESMKHTKTDL